MFPNGWPGCGLLLLRVANGVFVIYQLLPQLIEAQQFTPLSAAATLAAALLLVGIWTPIVGILLAVFELAIFLRGPGQPEVTIFLVAVALSLAMLGPGAWSADAMLFGRQRLEFPES